MAAELVMAATVATIIKAFMEKLPVLLLARNTRPTQHSNA
jgi:hypothetical protein